MEVKSYFFATQETCTRETPNPSPHSVKPNEHEHFEDKDFHFPGPQMCPGCKEERVLTQQTGRRWGIRETRRG